MRKLPDAIWFVESPKDSTVKFWNLKNTESFLVEILAASAITQKLFIKMPLKLSS